MKGGECSWPLGPVMRGCDPWGWGPSGERAVASLFLPPLAPPWVVVTRRL